MLGEVESETESVSLVQFHTQSFHKEPRSRFFGLHLDRQEYFCTNLIY